MENPLADAADGVYIPDTLMPWVRKRGGGAGGLSVSMKHVYSFAVFVWLLLLVVFLCKHYLRLVFFPNTHDMAFDILKSRACAL